MKTLNHDNIVQFKHVSSSQDLDKKFYNLLIDDVTYIIIDKRDRITNISGNGTDEGRSADWTHQGEEEE